MRITCPACGYRRDIPWSMVPADAAVATCPKCRTRFAFREGAGVPDDDNFLLEQGRGEEPEIRKEEDGESRDDSPDKTQDSAPGENREKDIWDRLGAGSGERGQDGPPGDNGQAQAEAFAPGFDPPHDGWDAPWERLDLHGFFQGFWLTVKGVMFAAPTFFNGLRVGNGFARPLIFYILIMELEALCQYLWHTMGIGFMTDMEGVARVGGGHGGGDRDGHAACCSPPCWSRWASISPRRFSISC